VARLSSIDPPGKLTFDGDLENATLGTLVGGFVDKAEAITGPTGLEARIGLDLGRPTLDARALSGKIDLASRDIRMPGFDLERAVLDKVEEKLGGLAALAAAALDSGRASPPEGEDRNAPRDLLQTLTASVDFDRWPWGLERMALEASGLSATGAGTLDPTAGNVTLDLVARLTPERTSKLVDRARYLRPLVDRDGRLSLPVKVKGALLAPSVEVDLRKWMASREGGTEETVKGLIDSLLDRKNKKKKSDDP
jgi:hypothetical protein